MFLMSKNGQPLELALNRVQTIEENALEAFYQTPNMLFLPYRATIVIHNTNGTKPNQQNHKKICKKNLQKNEPNPRF